MISPACPLCSNSATRPYHVDGFREYHHCPACELVFVHPDAFLDRDTEFQRYELHQNDIGNTDYRHFLEKLSVPLLSRISPNSHGLDFGSGPSPHLQRLFESNGHDMSIFDSFYAPDAEVFADSYDFITASEVVEHLYRPLVELDRLWGCLKPQGYLGVMTSLRFPEMDFSAWHYISDPTHVMFFAPQTMIWLASRWGAQLELIGNSVVIFYKNNSAAS